MIAATMLSLTLVSALIALAALAVERACIRLALPRRFIWLAAMGVMCAAPLLPDGVLTRVPIDRPETTATATAPASAPAAGPAASQGWWPPYGATVTVFGALPMAILVGAAKLVAASAHWLRPLDTPLLALWGLTTLALLTLTVRAALTLQRVQRGWIIRHRGGVNTPPVYVSDDVGPAAFGVGRGEIVIPRWAMQLPPLERRLLLLHERSHIEAGDPRLLAAGLAMVVALPWLFPLRWAYRRLQRAIEHDCDRRVLHRPHLARRYADLLLLAAERGVTTRGWSQRALACLGGPGLTMTSLLGAEPALEARLRSLVSAPVTLRARLDASLGLALGTMLTLVACTVPVPQPLALTPSPDYSRFATTGLLQRDLQWARGAGGHANRDSYDVNYLARNDSLVIAAITTSQPALMRLAQTTAPYVAVALSNDNEVVAASVRAGVPPHALAAADAAALDARLREASRRAGLGAGDASDADFAGKFGVMINEPETFIDDIGISHLRVGENPLTVLWVRLKARGL